MSSEVEAEECPIVSEEEVGIGVENGLVSTFLLPCSDDDGGVEGEEKRRGVLHFGGRGEQVAWGTKTVLARVNHCCGVLKKSWFVDEAAMLLKLAFPLCIMFIFNQLPFFITLQFVGHFSGARELSATAFRQVMNHVQFVWNMLFINITGYSVLIGIATAADTLGPQSFGFKNYKRVGVILQRGLLILSVAIVWLNSESLLLLARQAPCVVSLTGKYTRIFVLAFPCMMLYIMLQKYMQAQSLVWVFSGIGLTANIISVLSCAVLIVVAKLGTVGASLTMVLVYTLSPVLLIIYIKWRKLHLQTWGGWSFESLTEWWQFLRLGIPGLLTVVFEWWSFEIGALVSGSISELQLAISATILQLGVMYYMVPLGMAQAANVRVGNELGAGNITSAKRASFVAVGIQTMFAVFITVVTFACRDYIGFIFTSDQDVVAGVGDALIGAMGVIFMDQIQGVLTGLMRATGKQVSMAVVNFCSYYIVGLPLGTILALKLDMKAKGVWTGLSVGISLQGGKGVGVRIHLPELTIPLPAAEEVPTTVILLVLLLTTNWKKQSEKAMANARSGGGIVATDHTSSPSPSMEEHCADTELISVRGIDNKFGNNQGHPLPLDDQGHPLPLDDPMKEELVREDETSCEELNCQETNHYCANGDGGEGEVGRTKLLYKSSSKLCQSRSSILVCRGLTLLVCVALLFGGVLVAVTVRHHPTGCDQGEVLVPAGLNCSILCYQSTTHTIGVMLTPTKVLVSPTGNLLVPMPTTIQVAASPTVQVQQTTEGGSELVESDCQCVIMPTPSLLG